MTMTVTPKKTRLLISLLSQTRLSFILLSPCTGNCVGHKTLISFVFTFLRRFNLLELFFARIRSAIKYKIYYAIHCSAEKKQFGRARETLQLPSLWNDFYTGGWMDRHSRNKIKAMNLTVKSRSRKKKLSKSQTFGYDSLVCVVVNEPLSSSRSFGVSRSRQITDSSIF